MFLKSLFGISRMSTFYAVAKGRQTGIFNTWPECERQVKGFSKPVYKKFKCRADAEKFMKENSDLPESLRNVPETISNHSSSHYYKLGSKEKGLTLEPGHPKKLEKFVDYWPEGDEFQDGDDDEEYLTAAMDEAEGIPEKRLRLGKSSDYPDLELLGTKVIKGIEFPINNNGYVLVYTDGSCINNGTSSAVAGYGVFFAENHPLNAAEPVKGRATNNVGEILAAVHAIATAKEYGIVNLCIATDSQFLINAVEKWMRGWKVNGWKTSSGQSVKNFNEFIQLDEQLQDKTVNIKWVHVRGHRGIFGNEMADKLARKGAAKFRSHEN